MRGFASLGLGLIKMHGAPFHLFAESHPSCRVIRIAGKSLTTSLIAPQALHDSRNFATVFGCAHYFLTSLRRSTRLSRTLWPNRPRRPNRRGEFGGCRASSRRYRGATGTDRHLGEQCHGLGLFACKGDETGGIQTDHRSHLSWGCIWHSRGFEAHAAAQSRHYCPGWLGSGLSEHSTPVCLLRGQACCRGIYRLIAL